jgi:multidrug efflux pump subunit AcrB
MNPIVFALRRPVTIMMIVVALIGGGILALDQMRVDIFPAIKAPQIYVVDNYAGMDPDQIEGIVTNVYEQNFQYVDGVKDIESKSIQNFVQVKLSFYPGTDMAAAMSQVVSLTNRARGQMPPSVLPPFVIRFDAANVPIGYLVMESKSRPLGELADLGLFRIRPILVAEVPGTVSFSPYGSNTRAIVVTVDPDRLRAHNFTPEDVVSALERGNVVAPSGNLFTRAEMPLVPTNAMVVDPRVLGEIPVQLGKDVYIRDVGTIEDTTDINYGCALVNGRKSIYIPVVKKDTASTLTVVRQIHEAMPLFRSVVPEDVEVRYEFDESPTVRAAIKSVATEGVIGATLVGLMILLFLRDVRTLVVVLLNIPLALTGSLVGLWLTNNTLNIMSLGGLALVIGILVDESTVEVENIHKQMEKTDSIARAVRRGNQITAVPRLLAMLCILSVFIPTFILNEPVRSLFMPLTLAVGFAMIASYLLSSTLVPVLSVWLIRHRGQESHRAGLFERVLPRFARLVEATVRRRWAVVLSYLAACGLLIWLVGSRVGTELFPEVDSGQFVLRFRAPPGSEYELTRRCAIKILEVVDEQSHGNLAMSIGYVGLGATNVATNNILLFMRASDDGLLRVRLRKDSGVAVAELRDRLREALPEQVIPWLQEALRERGYSPEEAYARAQQVSFGFEPGDIVSTVMSFGSPTPIEVMVIGPEREAVRKHAVRVLEEMKKVPGLRDVQLYQQLDYPTVRVDIDRQKAGLSGVAVNDVTDALLVGTSSSRYVVRNFWLDPRSGVDYQVQVQAPTERMDRPQQVETLPLEKVTSESNLMVRDVATVRPGTTAGEIDRSAMQRYLSITANIEGDDLGRATGNITRAIADAGEPPRGVRVSVRGQVAPMREMFRSLTVGLTLSVVVILVLLTGYFQSFRLGLISIGGVPGVICGVAIILLATGTTLNIESFMGSIMCVGVSVSNSVMLSTFMNDHWRAGAPARQAAVEGARDRLRPILMTATAMVLGTVPMALALEEGSGMTAPLGRAVIGGLLVSTFATLLVVPAMFALVMRDAKKASPSLDPDDPSSRLYDPAGHDGTATHGRPRPKKDPTLPGAP